MPAIVASLTRRPLKERIKPCSAIVLHGTGNTDLGDVLHWYTAADAQSMPHYLIELDGQIRQTAQEHRIAWHAGMKPAEAICYKQDWGHWSKHVWSQRKGVPVEYGQEWGGYRIWRETWRSRGYQSPLDLPTGRDVNGSSVGVELLSPSKRGRRIYTDAQYQSLAELCVDIGQRHQIPLDRLHLLSHSDTSPMRRCVESGPYDPGRAFDYSHLFDLIGLEEDTKPGVIPLSVRQ